MRLIRVGQPLLPSKLPGQAQQPAVALARRLQVVPLLSNLGQASQVPQGQIRLLRLREQLGQLPPRLRMLTLHRQGILQRLERLINLTHLAVDV